MLTIFLSESLRRPQDMFIGFGEGGTIKVDLRESGGVSLSALKWHAIASMLQ